MNAWKHTLDAYKVTWDEEAHSLSPITPSDSATRIIPLVQRAAFSVTGPDAEKFLQGQLTCDLREVNENGSRLGAHCTPKGSMIALYRLMKLKDGYLLHCPANLFEAGFAALKKYSIFSKVEMLDLRESNVGLGLIGPGAESLMHKLFESIPTEVDRIVTQDGLIGTRLPGCRFELWMATDQSADVLKSLIDMAPLGSTNDWELSEIMAGVPDVEAASTEQYIPQMTNLQALKGVSFKKGCYTGQEIVARLQHRGKLNKPMYLVDIETDALPSIGTPIHSDNRQHAGHILRIAKTETGVKALAVITKTEADEHPLSLDGGGTVTVAELPYDLDPELFLAKR
jgi:folate-binding protein YgfZ